MPNKFSSFVSVVVAASLLFMPSATLNLPIVPGGLPDAAESLVPPSAEAKARLEEAFGQLPLYFVENQGQVDEEVAYYIQGGDNTLYFTAEGITFVLTVPFSSTVTAEEETFLRHEARAVNARQRWTVKLDFVGANPEVRPIGEERAEAVISYFKGPMEAWHSGLPTYNRLAYYDLWPGIDLVFYGMANQLKYDFLVHPGADPTQIQMVYRGAEDVMLNGAGQLEVATPLGGFTDDAPVGYQEIDGRRVDVAVAYALGTEGGEGLPDHRYSFGVGAYDPNYVLVLDPVVLIYCGYIGGSDQDGAFGIAVDGEGNVYITGETKSSEIEEFPVAVGPDLANNGSYDVFVAKVNTAGTALIYCGYIGGLGSDYVSSGAGGNGIVVDETGSAYITGSTRSSETEGFPVTVGPDLTFNGGDSIDNAFVAKVNAAGTALVYCGYIGGSDYDYGIAIAVDGVGNAYITGRTESNEEIEGFPVTVGPDLIFNGGDDVFVTKVNTAGTALIYCGYIGGLFGDSGIAIAVDGTGSAYITGYTYSSETEGFPVTVGPDLTHNGHFDVFVAKVNAAGTALVYCGYIGGSDCDDSNAIAVDGVGNAYITGLTESDEEIEGFPVAVGPDLTFNGSEDVFVAKVNTAGTA